MEGCETCVVNIVCI